MEPPSGPVKQVRDTDDYYSLEVAEVPDRGRWPAALPRTAFPRLMGGRGSGRAALRRTRPPRTPERCRLETVPATVLGPLCCVNCVPSAHDARIASTSRIGSTP